MIGKVAENFSNGWNFFRGIFQSLENGVGLDEASDFGVVVTGIVIIKASFAVELLSGEQVVYGDAEVKLVVNFTVGGVLHMLDEIAAAIGDDVRSAEMIGVVEQQFLRMIGRCGQVAESGHVLGDHFGISGVSGSVEVDISVHETSDVAHGADALQDLTDEHRIGQVDELIAIDVTAREHALSFGCFGEGYGGQRNEDESGCAFTEPRNARKGTKQGCDGI